MKNLRMRISTSLLLILLVYLIFNYMAALVFSLIIMGIFSLIEFFEIAKKIYKKKLFLFLVNFLFVIFVFIFCIMFFLLSNILQLKILLFIFLLTCVASDIGGFIFGKIFKGPKLTKISPNKTIAGAVGSIILSGLVFSYLIYLITNNFNFLILCIAMITSIGCQSGDLFFSLLKRKANIKDTGNFLPGHGGFLDRLDGIFIGIPLGFITFVLIY